VKAPRDPNQTTDPDEAEGEEQEIEPPEGAGLDQGVVATVEEHLTRAALAAPTGSTGIAARTYLGVGISKNGRAGVASKRVAVPLVPPPPPPASVSVTYDERAVTIGWVASPEGVPDLGAAVDLPAPSLGYHVYDVTQKTATPPTPRSPLTKTPVTDETFKDERITWGEMRCYAVRAVWSYAQLVIESEEARPPCVTLNDTFPPVQPKGLTSVASEGAISLIWEPNGESDLDGYIIVRGATVNRMLPVTGVIRETTFRDTVTPGARFFYAVRAVDTVGNVGPDSAPIEETSR
jgi:hypothetical protein